MGLACGHCNFWRDRGNRQHENQIRGACLLRANAQKRGRLYWLESWRKCKWPELLATRQEWEASLCEPSPATSATNPTARASVTG